MIADPTYSKRVQLCIRCPHGSRRTGACTVDRKQYHDHALSGECQKGYYSVSGRMPPPAIIDPDYVPTPTNATLGGCNCKK